MRIFGVSSWLKIQRLFSSKGHLVDSTEITSKMDSKTDSISIVKFSKKLTARFIANRNKSFFFGTDCQRAQQECTNNKKLHFWRPWKELGIEKIEMNAWWSIFCEIYEIIWLKIARIPIKSAMAGKQRPTMGRTIIWSLSSPNATIKKAVKQTPQKE